jgi:pyridoxal phosphate enzyme (YggS family)
MENIAERLKSTQASIQRSTQEANRRLNSVKLLAVSKTKPVSDIVQAYEAGQRLFGENYVQEALDKIKTLAGHTDIEWHFIGPLQSNKSRLVAENFDWVHTVDRIKIARRLSEQRSVRRTLNLCIQVNIDQDENKSGVAVSELDSLASAIQSLPNLTLRGLMTIPMANQSEQAMLASFTKMQDLFKDLQSRYPDIDTLSMGMSDDMQQAIRCGSTMVRVGTGIFGPRPNKQEKI